MQVQQYPAVIGVDDERAAGQMVGVAVPARSVAVRSQVGEVQRAKSTLAVVVGSPRGELGDGRVAQSSLGRVGRGPPSAGPSSVRPAGPPSSSVLSAVCGPAPGTLLEQSLQRGVERGGVAVHVGR